MRTRMAVIIVMTVVPVHILQGIQTQIPTAIAGPIRVIGQVFQQVILLLSQILEDQPAAVLQAIVVPAVQAHQAIVVPAVQTVIADQAHPILAALVALPVHIVLPVHQVPHDHIVLQAHPVRPPGHTVRHLQVGVQVVDHVHQAARQAEEDKNTFQS